jgi:hypothetical protein
MDSKLTNPLEINNTVSTNELDSLSIQDGGAKKKRSYTKKSSKKVF